jgi:arylsulfatase A-like enzyme
MSALRFLFICIFSLLASHFRLTSSEAADRPNVLFIAVDDLNDWIGCLGGHPQCQTPNIDALAARGVLFTKAYCAAPACNPSRAALLSGKRPSTSGVYVNPQPWRESMQGVITLPQHFQSEYKVHGGGKIYHGAFKDPQSWHHYENRPGDPEPSTDVLKDPHSKAGGIVFGHLDVDDSKMGDYILADWAGGFLQKKHAKPFFLACGFYRPHMPWQVPRKYYDMYPLDEIVLPEVPDNDLNDIPAAGVKMAKPKGDHATINKTDNWRHAVQAYLASITFVDGQVGRLIKFLDESQYTENTIVVLWGDHGWHLGEKKHWRKFSLWEEATRAPLIMIAPGVTKPNSRCDRTVDFMNIYPTLSSLCDLPRPDHVEGFDMTALLKNPNADWSHPAITTHGRKNHAVRTEQYRYIQYADGSQELYDHNNDPNEWMNLAAKPAMQPIISRLQSHLKTLKNVPDGPYVKNLKKSKPKKTPGT